MSNEKNFGANDPLGMLRTMWSNMGLNLPSMVTPTLDCDELDKRISDLKVVEGWLSMNLSMLQITIKSLEMQTATLRTVQSMGEMASSAAEKVTKPGMGAAAASAGKTGMDAQMWPLMLMQQLQEYTRRQAEAATEAKDEIKARTAPQAETESKKKTSK